MNLKLFLFGSFVIVILISSFLVFTYRNILIPERILLGAWTEGLYDPKSQVLHPEKLLQFENLIHKKVAIAHFYRGWESLDDPNLINQFTLLRSNGWIPMINVNPYFFSECTSMQKLTLYKAISHGDCDTFLEKAGQNLSKVKQPFYFLFAWEMNNPQNTWSLSQTGDDTNDFIEAWKHVYKIFKEKKVINSIWVFCPNVPNTELYSYETLYPGSDYVDWVGMDGYNWGTTQSWSHWTSFSGEFSLAYNELSKIAPEKPLMLAEVNSTDQGGDKGNWYIDMFDNQIPKNFPNIKAVVIFNENRSLQENVNWKVDISKSSLDSFIRAIHTKYY